MNTTNKLSVTLGLKPLVAAISLLAIAGHASAVGVGTVAAGAATINTNGATTTINQSTDRAIVNWNNFDIDTGQSVKINQPTAQSAILNRVNSVSKTQIDGALNANGRVFVVNPNGVVVGKTGSINANGVVLSTLDVSDNSFTRPFGGSAPLAFRQVAGAANAAVVNDGTINAGGAGVSLFGSQVINSATGTITAKGAGGTTMANVSLTNVNLVASNTIDASEAVSNKSLMPTGYTDKPALLAPVANNANGTVTNNGKIKVDNGYLMLGVAPGAGVTSTSVSNTGSIDVTGTSVELFPGVNTSIGGAIFVGNFGADVATPLGGSIQSNGIVYGTRQPISVGSPPQSSGTPGFVGSSTPPPASGFVGSSIPKNSLASLLK